MHGQRVSHPRTRVRVRGDRTLQATSSADLAQLSAMRLYAVLACTSGKGQTRDMIQLTTSPITQPRSTSPTLCRPNSIPLNLEWWVRPVAMTMAAVIGACRQNVWMWIRYDETRTVT